MHPKGCIKFLMTKNIIKEIFILSPQEAVWEALTNPNDISSWLMPTKNFKAVPGERFTMQAKPMGSWDGKIHGEILTVEYPSVLSYTWKGDQMKSNTVIKWTLKTKDGGTLLTLQHTGFTGFSDYILGVFHAMGWKKFLNQLKSLVTKR